MQRLSWSNTWNETGENPKEGLIMDIKEYARKYAKAHPIGYWGSARESLIISAIALWGMICLLIMYIQIGGPNQSLTVTVGWEYVPELIAIIIGLYISGTYFVISCMWIWILSKR